MKDVILDTVIDGLKLLPFLFIAFIIIELIEHKLKNKEIMIKTGKFGPLVGSILGVIPQCGFSVTATNLYATRIISLGTLISIYLSTSDEMVPILIGEGRADLVPKVLLIKVFIGMFCGFIIDLIFRKKNNSNHEISDLCEKEHCDCNHSIIKSAIKHTLSIFIFIFIVSFILNLGFEYLGEDTISKIFLKDSFFSPFVASLIGLIPNCASSVAITTVYLSGAITFGSAMAGLLTNSGVALMVLFKINHNIKENMKILLLIYGIGVISGIIINLLGII